MNCLGQKMDVIAVVPAIMLIFAENYLFIKLSAKQKIYFLPMLTPDLLAYFVKSKSDNSPFAPTSQVPSIVNLFIPACCRNIQDHKRQDKCSD